MLSNCIKFLRKLNNESTKSGNKDSCRQSHLDNTPVSRPFHYCQIKYPLPNYCDTNIIFMGLRALGNASEMVCSQCELTKIRKVHVLNR